MVLARWQATIVDDGGNVQNAASVEVRREMVGAPLAVVYSDRDGAVPLANPMTADADGFAAFHVPGGAYKITATKGSFSRVWRYVAIGTAGERDAENFVAGNIIQSGYTDMAEISPPSAPAANTARVYPYDEQGKTRMGFIDSSGAVTRIRRAADFLFQTYR